MSMFYWSHLLRYIKIFVCVCVCVCFKYNVFGFLSGTYLRIYYLGRKRTNSLEVLCSADIFLFVQITAEYRRRSRATRPASSSQHSALPKVNLFDIPPSVFEFFFIPSFSTQQIIGLRHCFPQDTCRVPVKCLRWQQRIMKNSLSSRDKTLLDGRCLTR
jgi:hypothetical protein